MRIEGTNISLLLQVKYDSAKYKKQLHQVTHIGKQVGLLYYVANKLNYYYPTMHLLTYSLPYYLTLACLLPNRRVTLQNGTETELFGRFVDYISQHFCSNVRDAKPFLPKYIQVPIYRTKATRIKNNHKADNIVVERRKTRNKTHKTHLGQRGISRPHSSHTQTMTIVGLKKAKQVSMQPYIQFVVEVPKSNIAFEKNYTQLFSIEMKANGD